MKDAPSHKKCPHCKCKCERYYGSMNFTLKGSGWPSKEIKNGHKITKHSKIEDVMQDRAKKGLETRSKEKPMSDAEYKKRLALNKRWLEEKS